MPIRINKDVNLSYWERKVYFSAYDLIVIGSGIVGLNAALHFKHRNKKARVLVLERGILPDGASTKNAGFACFGSTGELLDDLEKMPEALVWQTVEMRWKGLALLRKTLGDKGIGYAPSGGHELFRNGTEYEKCLNAMAVLNTNMKSVTGKSGCFYNNKRLLKHFSGICGAISNQYEGLIDTGRMMKNLLALTRLRGVEILNNVHVESLKDQGNKVVLHTQLGDFCSSKVIVATNGFAAQLLKLKHVKPARAQVLVTSPVNKSFAPGGFHLDKGYYYFRQVDGRILFGGGRNLDFEGETTTVQGLHPKIQKQLDVLLRTLILPGETYEIENRWSGIMGVGKEKKPVIAPVSSNVLAAVRMGGMGVAIGSLVGRVAATTVM